jgi:hypothetical protein
LIFCVGLLSIGFVVLKGKELINLSSRHEPYTAEAFSGPVQRDGASASGGRAASATCMPAEDISHALRSFMSDNFSEIDKAQALLRAKSRESEQCRSEVIGRSHEGHGSARPRFHA